MRDLKRIFSNSAASSAEDIARRLQERADNGKSRYTSDQMFLLIAMAYMRSSLKDGEREALNAIDPTESRAVRMLNLLSVYEGSPTRFSTNRGHHPAPPGLQ